MVQGEAKVAELESKTFRLAKSLDAGVNVDLLSKTIISVVGDKHHGHPVIAGATRNLFRATANYIFHKDLFSCRTFNGQANACRVRQKKSMVYLWRKIEMRLFICGSYADASDHAVFPVATIKNKKLILICL